MRIRFIQQDPWIAPGEYLAWAERHGYETKITRCWEFEDVPDEPDADMLVVLGGMQNPATSKEECPYFDSSAERALISKYVDEEKIVIGICLGAQLVGEALGAPYLHSPEREIGPVETRLTEEGRADPFFADFPDVFPTGQWHNDMPGLTDDAEIIAESDGCPRQIVRYGRWVYGFQAHMEFTPEIIEGGIEQAAPSLKKPGRYIQTAEQLRSYDYTEMNALLSGFLDALVDDWMNEKAGREAGNRA